MKNMLILAFLLCAAGAAAPIEWMSIANFKVKEGQEKFAPTAEIKDGDATLENRGTLVSQKMYPNGAILTTTWTWVDGQEEGKYHDHLCMVFFSTAEQKKWPYEADNGVIIRLNPGAGHIVVQHFTNGEEVTRLATKDGLKFEKAKDYKLRVEVTKTTFTVLVDGVKQAEGKIPEGLKGEKVLVYNREPVAGVVHKSILYDLTITAQK